MIGEIVHFATKEIADLRDHKNCSWLEIQQHIEEKYNLHLSLGKIHNLYYGAKAHDKSPINIPSDLRVSEIGDFIKEVLIKDPVETILVANGLREIIKQRVNSVTNDWIPTKELQMLANSFVSVERVSKSARDSLLVLADKYKITGDTFKAIKEGNQEDNKFEVEINNHTVDPELEKEIQALVTDPKYQDKNAKNKNGSSTPPGKK